MAASFVFGYAAAESVQRKVSSTRGERAISAALPPRRASWAAPRAADYGFADRRGSFGCGATTTPRTVLGARHDPRRYESQRIRGRPEMGSTRSPFKVPEKPESADAGTAQNAALGLLAHTVE